MVFIRPKILRTDEQSAIETNTKYNYIREEQRKVTGEREYLPLLPGVKQPELPPMAPAPQSDERTRADEPEEKEKASEQERRSRLVPPAATAPAAPPPAHGLVQPLPGSSRHRDLRTGPAALSRRRPGIRRARNADHP